MTNLLNRLSDLKDELVKIVNLKNNILNSSADNTLKNSLLDRIKRDEELITGFIEETEQDIKGDFISQLI